MPLLSTTHNYIKDYGCASSDKLNMHSISPTKNKPSFVASAIEREED